MADDDPVIPNPTYMGNIRNFFRPIDIQHMASKNIDIGTYDGCKTNATDIYLQTQPPDPSMPPPSAGGQWSQNKSDTFLNWIKNGFPMGTATPATPDSYTAAAVDDDAAAGTRLRKNVTSLSADEQAKIKQAFAGLMKLGTGAGSYYVYAGGHGLPKNWCQHHVDPFNPWHRAYLKGFEDLLRTVPGCEDVTLPYWDVHTDLPALLQEDGMAQYKLPADPGGYPNYTTQRYSVADIAANMSSDAGGYSVLEEIGLGQAQTLWGRYPNSGYQRWSIQAHDGGHGSIGPTMGNQDVASYDPVFWFYHCNIDRLWLAWQIKLSATTLPGFKTTLGGNTAWLSPPLNSLRGLTITSDQTIDGMGVSYDDYATDTTAEAAPVLENKVGSVEAGRTFSIKAEDPVSVRVKDIARLNIPGSFEVHLQADGETIAKRFFFQGTVPQDCENCQTVPLTNIDFRIDRDKILDKKLSVAIEVPSQHEEGTRFPLSQAGNPTVNARLLIEDE